MLESVIVTQRQGLGLATIMARKGIEPATIGAAIAIEPPTGPYRESSDKLALIGVGPGSRFAMADDAASGWATALKRRLTGLASVADQSGGYVVFRVAGPDAIRLLQQGVFIDLHPAIFPTGSAATTTIAHIGVILSRIDDAPSFEIALFRSYETSFRHWLDATRAAL